MWKLQDWVKHQGLRIVTVFEGRDGAGKGGTIRVITERVSPDLRQRWGPSPELKAAFRAVRDTIKKRRYW